jgi:hypothetical protein
LAVAPVAMMTAWACTVRPPEVVRELQDAIEGTVNANSRNVDADPNASIRDEDIIEGEIVNEEFPDKK